MAADDVAFQAMDHTRKVFEPSPRSPGYTCWTGAWPMPDGSLMVASTRAMRPVTGGPKAPPDVQAKLDRTSDYDVTGLVLRNVLPHLWNGARCRDMGDTQPAHPILRSPRLAEHLDGHAPHAVSRAARLGQFATVHHPGPPGSAPCASGPRP